MTSADSVQRLTMISLLFVLLAIDRNKANQLFSEGGTYLTQDDQVQQQSFTPSDGQTDFFGEEPNQQYQANYFPSTVEQHAEFEEQQERERLAKIINQLREYNQPSPQELAGGHRVFVEEDQQPNGNMENDWDELKGIGGEQENPEEITVLEQKEQKLAAVKKGQSEFVEFVEPQPRQNNRHKTPEWMEKRVPSESGKHSNAFKFFSNSGNILFMAYLAICCAGIVAGTFGGIYYYNHVRASRVEDPFNEFTRYSPAGPGKDKLKKVGGAGSPTFGQSGDDTLAYKAQLHHYQQQKQKILGTSGVVDNGSDNEEDTEEMDHNYSVFECPGLAPTGDLEIQNPNFTGGEKSAADPARRAE